VGLWKHAAGPDPALPGSARTRVQGPDDLDGVIVAIGETLIHEIGHYFGLSEDEIEAIEEQYWNDRA
jgi:hypothetical protein